MANLVLNKRMTGINLDTGNGMNEVGDGGGPLIALLPRVRAP